MKRLDLLLYSATVAMTVKKLFLLDFSKNRPVWYGFQNNRSIWRTEFRVTEICCRIYDNKWYLARHICTFCMKQLTLFEWIIMSYETEFPLESFLMLGKHEKNIHSTHTHLTFFCVSFLWCPQKAADPLRTDDENLQRGVERLDLFSYCESRCLFLLFLVTELCSQLFSAQGSTQPALDFKRNIGSSYYPRLANSPGRKYLIHEWTCLFIECHHDACCLLH